MWSTISLDSGKIRNQCNLRRQLLAYQVIYSIYENLRLCKHEHDPRKKESTCRSFLPGFKNICSLACFWSRCDFPAQVYVFEQMQAVCRPCAMLGREATAVHHLSWLSFVFLLKKCLFLVERNHWHSLHHTVTYLQDHGSQTQLYVQYLLAHVLASWRSLNLRKIRKQGFTLAKHGDAFGISKFRGGEIKLIMNSLKFIRIYPGEI